MTLDAHVQSELGEQHPSVLKRAGGLALNIILPSSTIAALVGFWWLGAILFGWKKFIVPTPGDVWSETVKYWSILPGHFEVTLIESLEGFGISIAIAVPVAFVIARSRILEATIYPALLALNSIPKIAIAPILIIWMGFGAAPKIVMVIMVCFFPIVISTATGLKSTPAEFVDLVRSYSGSEATQFIKVRFPAAMPYIFVGLKVAISLAVIGAVVGEFVGATKGLGYVIIASGESADTSLAFSAIALLSIMSIVLFYSVVLIERLLVPWAAHEQR
jgi:NitT/TauT family transport system permease protein